MTPALAIISAMITPALLILASASLVASALVRLARAVDRVRALMSAIAEGTYAKLGTDAAALDAWLVRFEMRALYAERAIALFFGAVAVFIAGCLTIAIDRAAGNTLTWLPVSLIIVGMLGLLGGAAAMVAESRLGGDQIRDEVRIARATIRP